MMLIGVVVGLALACLEVQNELPLIEYKPVLHKKVAGGQLYKLGSGNNSLLIAKVKGSAEEMGEAYGELFKTELKEQMDIFYSYLKGQVENALNIPQYFKNALGGTAQNLLKKVLWLNVMITKKYTNKRVMEEIRGISKTSGVSARALMELNIFPQLIKAACTVLGVWGKASSNGNTLHMRALDWDKNFPINKYALVTVYHSTEPNSKIYANIGYLGLIGMLTGVSEKLSIGEKVWIPAKNSVPTTRYGEPWTYVLRNVMQFGDDLASANRILADSHRTCTIHLGIASVTDHAFTMCLYSYKSLTVFDDNNYTYTKAHPKLPGVAYFDKHVQPSGDSCVGELTTKGYGKWTMESLWRVVGLSHQTGDTQLVVFDLEAKQALVSYSEHGTGVQAYRRSPMMLDLADLFKSF